MGGKEEREEHQRSIWVNLRRRLWKRTGYNYGHNNTARLRNR
jgi:hypothetical protein